MSRGRTTQKLASVEERCGFRRDRLFFFLLLVTVATVGFPSSYPCALNYRLELEQEWDCLAGFEREAERGMQSARDKKGARRRIAKSTTSIKTKKKKKQQYVTWSASPE